MSHANAVSEHDSRNERTSDREGAVDNQMAALAPGENALGAGVSRVCVHAPRVTGPGDPVPHGQTGKIGAVVNQSDRERTRNSPPSEVTASGGRSGVTSERALDRSVREREREAEKQARILPTSVSFLAKVATRPVLVFSPGSTAAVRGTRPKSGVVRSTGP